MLYFYFSFSLSSKAFHTFLLLCHDMQTSSVKESLLLLTYFINFPVLDTLGHTQKLDTHVQVRTLTSSGVRDYLNHACFPRSLYLESLIFLAVTVSYYFWSHNTHLLFWDAIVFWKSRVLVELAIPCGKRGPRVFKGFTVGFHPRSWEVVWNFFFFFFFYFISVCVFVWFLFAFCLLFAL